MKTLFYSIIILFTTSILAKAQNKQATSTYVVVNVNGKNIVTANLMLAGTKMEILEVVKKTDIPKYYDGKNENVVLLIVKPKPSAKLITLPELYSKYKINEKSQSLSIILDGKLIQDTINFLIDDNAITSVTATGSNIIIKSDIEAKSKEKL